MADFDVVVDTRILERIIADLPDKIDSFIEEVANEMLNDVVLSFGSSPPGIEYKRGDSVHVASSAGYPPNPDTGTLKASMTVSRERANERIVHDQTEYGVYQEYGTEAIEARPFLGPVARSWQNQKLAEFARQRFSMVD
jgi:phage gpG-like protein